MTEEPSRADQFRSHPDFEQHDDAAFAATTTPFDAVVALDDGTVSVTTPTLSAVVDGDAVADVVEDGWFDTLQLRLDDAHTVTETAADPPEITRDGDEVVCTVRFADAVTPRDALAVVEFVEGTWVQGIVPGYDYCDPAATLIERARQNYDEEEDGGVPL